MLRRNRILGVADIKRAAGQASPPQAPVDGPQQPRIDDGPGSAARRRDEQAQCRDRAAELRDRTSAAMQSVMLAAHPGNAPLGELARAFTDCRDQAASDRRRAAADRRAAAEDRIRTAAEQRQTRIELQRAQLAGQCGAFASRVGYASLEAELGRCCRHRAPFTLGCVQVNNSADHTDTAAVVQTVLAALSGHLRTYDPLVRTSRDEFLCAMPGAGAAAAHQRLAEIAAAVRHGHPPGTIAIGVAQLTGGEQLSELIARARTQLHPQAPA